MSEDNVIHVRFGPGGGRRVDPAPEESTEAKPAKESVPPPAFGRGSLAEPYGALFKAKEVARLFDVPLGRLRY